MDTLPNTVSKILENTKRFCGDEACLKVEVEIEVCLSRDSYNSCTKSYRQFCYNLHESKIEDLKKPDTAGKQSIFKRFMNIFSRRKEDTNLPQKSDFKTYHESRKRNVSPNFFAETKFYQETTTSGYYETCKSCASSKVFAKSNTLQKVSRTNPLQTYERDTVHPARQLCIRRKLETEPAFTSQQGVHGKCIYPKTNIEEHELPNTVSSTHPLRFESIETRDFFSALCEKLEKVKRDQDVRKHLGKCLKDFRPYNSSPEKHQLKYKNRSKVDRELNMHHRVHWEDHVLQENKVIQSSAINQGYDEVAQDYLSDNSQRENRPPYISKRQSDLDKGGVVDRCQRVLPIYHSERNYTNSGRASPEKTRNRRRIRSSKQNYTIVGFSYGAHSIPFMTRLPGNKITLGQFKSLINKKQKYRFFFKNYRSDFGTDIVFEEITNDSDILPLWDGKIYAIVEKI